MRLIIGLGNPGTKFKNTRHNVGFMVIDKICELMNVTLSKSRFNGETIKIDDMILAKPSTFMNLSGDFVFLISAFYKIVPEDILIIHDEKDFDLGQASIKIGGNDAGHNGVKSIIEKLGSTSFKRLRIGIGKKPSEKPLKDWVLENFNNEDWEKIQPILKVSADAAVSFAFNDIKTVMNSFNVFRRKNNEKSQK